MFVPLRARPWVEEFATADELSAALTRQRADRDRLRDPVRVIPFRGERLPLSVPAPTTAVYVPGATPVAPTMVVSLGDWLVAPPGGVDDVVRPAGPPVLGPG